MSADGVIAAPFAVLSIAVRARAAAGPVPPIARSAEPVPATARDTI